MFDSNFLSSKLDIVPSLSMNRLTTLLTSRKEEIVALIQNSIKESK